MEVCDFTHSEVRDFNHKTNIRTCVISPVPLWEKAQLGVTKVLWKIATVIEANAKWLCCNYLQLAPDVGGFVLN